MKKTGLKCEKGVSLIEVVIVMTIAIVFVVIALPRGIRQLQIHRLDTSVAVVSEKISEARMTAIKRNRTSWLRIDKTARTAQIKSTDPVTAAEVDVGFPEKLPQGVVLDGTVSVNITFDSMGLSTGGTQTFTLREGNANATEAITVSPAGKVTVGGIH